MHISLQTVNPTVGEARCDTKLPSILDFICRPCTSASRVTLPSLSLSLSLLSSWAAPDPPHLNHIMHWSHDYVRPLLNSSMDDHAALTQTSGLFFLVPAFALWKILTFPVSQLAPWNLHRKPDHSCVTLGFVVLKAQTVSIKTCVPPIQCSYSFLCQKKPALWLHLMTAA